MGGSLVRMTGVLAGRWEAARLLTSLQTVADPLDSTKRLCVDSGPTYEFAKGKICESMDIASDPTTDGTGVCNALSMGLGFEATLANFGPLVDAPPPSTICGIGYSDSCQ